LLRAGRPGDAVVPLREAARWLPGNAAILHDLGLACLECGRIGEAVTALQSSVAVDPGFQDSHLRLGIALEAAGGIPDQFRVDQWQQDFNKDVAAGKIPSLETLWIMCDHTGGPPGVAAAQADNDLAVGRIIDAISHSPVWKDSVIFVTEDDAQDGVDHIDGHRSPGYVVSPYVIQARGGQAVVNHTAFTQVNMTRTIEQILGLPPMNQFDLVASPMSNLFTDNPPESNFAPWNHVAATVALCTTGASPTAPYYTGVLSGYTIVNGACVPTTTTARNLRKLKPIEKAWAQAKNKIFNGKQHIPDAEDPVVVNHWVWYEATGYSRPYPGEAKVLWPAAFRERISAAKPEIDD